MCGGVLESKQLIQWSRKTDLFILLGELSGGIYFLHVFIIRIIKIIGRTVPPVTTFPINTVLIVFISAVIILICKKILPKKLCVAMGFC